MSYVNQEPIYKIVCVQTEQRLVGFREAPLLLDPPSAEEGGYAFVDLKQYDGPQQDWRQPTPGVLVYGDAPTPSAPPIDAPGALILMLAGAFLLYALVGARRA